MTFWNLLYHLVNNHTSLCVVTPSGWNEPQYAPILYGGNCLQSFLIALKSGGTQAWYYLTWAVWP